MLTNKSSAKGQVTEKKGRLTEKTTSIHGRVDEDMAAKLTRPRAVPVPDSISGRIVVTTETMTRTKLRKLLLNVTVQRNLVPVHVLISPESTVGDLIATTLRQYSKEGRRPVFPSLNPPEFDLHYSQFCLDRLPPDEKLKELGSRNFFLCPKQLATVPGSTGGHDGIGTGNGGMSATSSTVLIRFMEFML